MTHRQVLDEIKFYREFEDEESKLTFSTLDLALRLKREKDLFFQDENSYKTFLKSVTHEDNGALVVNDEFCYDKVFTETINGVTEIFTVRMIKETI